MNKQEKKRDLRCAIEEYLWHCRIEKCLDEKTLGAYKVDLLQFMEIVGYEDVDRLSKEQIRGYLKAISHFSFKTRKRKLASLKAMLNYYEYENDGFVNPLRRMQIQMREPIRLPTIMTINEVKAMLITVRERRKACKSGSFSFMMATRDIAVVELLFATGMRVSELCDLRISDVDIVQGRIKIIGKGNKERLIDICQDKTLKALKEWLNQYENKTPDSPLFISRLYRKLSPQSVRQLVKNLVEGVGMVKHVTPHTFRHTLATLLLEEDVDITYIQKLLGHSSIVTTQIYTHVNLHKQREILKSKHPRRLI